MTVEEEFLEFKKWFLYWKKRLGLNSWRVLEFTRCPWSIDSPYAKIHYITAQREAWLYFYGCGDGVREGWAKEKALHECLHLLFAPLNLDDGAEHSLINIILNVFLYPED